MGKHAKDMLPGKAAVGMGILGVALAAFEHFSEQKKASGPGAPPPPYPNNASPVGNTPPPPPPGGAPGSIPPGPPSMGTIASPPPPPAPGASSQAPQGADPVLLLRAMIAAAYADGVLDDTERSRITFRLEQAGLTGEERDFMRRELDAPRPPAEIVSSVTSREAAEQVYAFSLLAIEVNTDAERAYLEDLRRALGLDPGMAADIVRRIGR